MHRINHSYWSYQTIQDEVLAIIAGSLDIESDERKYPSCVYLEVLKGERTFDSEHEVSQHFKAPNFHIKHQLSSLTRCQSFVFSLGFAAQVCHLTRRCRVQSSTNSISSLESSKKGDIAVEMLLSKHSTLQVALYAPSARCVGRIPCTDKRRGCTRRPLLNRSPSV